MDLCGDSGTPQGTTAIPLGDPGLSAQSGKAWSAGPVGQAHDPSVRTYSRAPRDGRARSSGARERCARLSLAGPADAEVSPSADMRSDAGTARPDESTADLRHRAGRRGASDPSGLAALRSILRIRPFRRLWLVLGVASLGDWLGLLATSIFAPQQVTGATAKGVAFGGVIAVRLLPALLLGPGRRRAGRPVRPALHDGRLRPDPVRAVRLDPAGRAGDRPTRRQIIAWTAIATFLIEAVTMAWLPAKDAAVPNLLPQGRLETANQLTLATTYGVTPVAGAPYCSPA